MYTHYLEITWRNCTLPSQRVQGETRGSASLRGSQALWMLPVGGPPSSEGCLISVSCVSAWTGNRLLLAENSQEKRQRCSFQAETMETLARCTEQVCGDAGVVDGTVSFGRAC